MLGNEESPLKSLPWEKYRYGNFSFKLQKDLQQMKEYYDKCSTKLTTANQEYEILEKKYEGKRLTTFEMAFMEKERNDLSNKLESLQ